MLKTEPINNFLLLKYVRKELAAPPASNFSKNEEELYLQCQDILFYRTVEQINFFHPNAHIHVLTNEYLKSSSSISYYVYNENWTNMLCKFKLYSLIDEPAMFIDLDVIFNRPIYISESDAPFCFFNTSWGVPLQEYANKNLPINQSVIYNSGVTWIKTPNKNITDELLELHKTYFSDEEMMLSKNLWPNNDEHALSLFVGIHNHTMPLNSKINMSRNKLEKLNIEMNADTIKKYQSVHYNGVLTKQKMIDEYGLFEMSKHHTNANIKQVFNI